MIEKEFYYFLVNNKDLQKIIDECQLPTSDSYIFENGWLNGQQLDTNQLKDLNNKLKYRSSIYYKNQIIVNIDKNDETFIDENGNERQRPNANSPYELIVQEDGIYEIILSGAGGSNYIDDDINLYSNISNQNIWENYLRNKYVNHWETESNSLDILKFNEKYTWERINYTLYENNYGYFYSSGYYKINNTSLILYVEDIKFFRIDQEKQIITDTFLNTEYEYFRNKDTLENKYYTSNYRDFNIFKKELNLENTDSIPKENIELYKNKYANLFCGDQDTYKNLFYRIQFEGETNSFVAIVLNKYKENWSKIIKLYQKDGSNTFNRFDGSVSKVGGSNNDYDKFGKLIEDERNNKDWLLRYRNPVKDTTFVNNSILGNRGGLYHKFLKLKKNDKLKFINLGFLNEKIIVESDVFDSQNIIVGSGGLIKIENDSSQSIGYNTNPFILDEEVENQYYGSSNSSQYYGRNLGNKGEGIYKDLNKLNYYYKGDYSSFQIKYLGPENDLIKVNFNYIDNNQILSINFNNNAEKFKELNIQSVSLEHYIEVATDTRIEYKILYDSFNKEIDPYNSKILFLSTNKEYSFSEFEKDSYIKRANLKIKRNCDELEILTFTTIQEDVSINLAFRERKPKIYIAKKFSSSEISSFNVDEDIVIKYLYDICEFEDIYILKENNLNATIKYINNNLLNRHQFMIESQYHLDILDKIIPIQYQYVNKQDIVTINQLNHDIFLYFNTLERKLVTVSSNLFNRQEDLEDLDNNPITNRIINGKISNFKYSYDYKSIVETTNIFFYGHSGQFIFLECQFNGTVSRQNSSETFYILTIDYELSLLYPNTFIYEAGYDIFENNINHQLQNFNMMIPSIEQEINLSLTTKTYEIEVLSNNALIQMTTNKQYYEPGEYCYISFTIPPTLKIEQINITINNSEYLIPIIREDISNSLYTEQIIENIKRHNHFVLSEFENTEPREFFLIHKNNTIYDMPTSSNKINDNFISFIEYLDNQKNTNRRFFYNINLTENDLLRLNGPEDIMFKIKMKYNHIQLKFDFNYLQDVSILNVKPGEDGTIRIIKKGFFRVQMCGGNTGNGGNGFKAPPTLITSDRLTLKQSSTSTNNVVSAKKDPTGKKITLNFQYPLDNLIIKSLDDIYPFLQPQILNIGEIPGKITEYVKSVYEETAAAGQAFAWNTWLITGKKHYETGPYDAGEYVYTEQSKYEQLNFSDISSLDLNGAAGNWTAKNTILTENVTFLDFTTDDNTGSKTAVKYKVTKQYKDRVTTPIYGRYGEIVGYNTTKGEWGNDVVSTPSTNIEYDVSWEAGIGVPGRKDDQTYEEHAFVQGYFSKSTASLFGSSGGSDVDVIEIAIHPNNDFSNEIEPWEVCGLPGGSGGDGFIGGDSGDGGSAAIGIEEPHFRLEYVESNNPGNYLIFGGGGGDNVNIITKDYYINRAVFGHGGAPGKPGNGFLKSGNLGVGGLSASIPTVTLAGTIMAAANTITAEHIVSLPYGAVIHEDGSRLDDSKIHLINKGVQTGIGLPSQNFLQNLMWMKYRGAYIDCIVYFQENTDLGYIVGENGGDGVQGKEVARGEFGASGGAGGMGSPSTIYSSAENFGFKILNYNKFMDINKLDPDPNIFSHLIYEPFILPTSFDNKEPIMTKNLIGNDCINTAIITAGGRAGDTIVTREPNIGYFCTISTNRGSNSLAGLTNPNNIYYLHRTFGLVKSDFTPTKFGSLVSQSVGNFYNFSDYYLGVPSNKIVNNKDTPEFIYFPTLKNNSGTYLGDDFEISSGIEKTIGNKSSLSILREMTFIKKINNKEITPNYFLGYGAGDNRIMIKSDAKEINSFINSDTQRYKKNINDEDYYIFNSNELICGFKCDNKLGEGGKPAKPNVKILNFLKKNSLCYYSFIQEYADIFHIDPKNVFNDNVKIREKFKRTIFNIEMPNNGPDIKIFYLGNEDGKLYRNIEEEGVTVENYYD